MISIFYNINQFAGRWKILDAFAVFCARYLPYFMVFFLFLYYLLQNNFKIFIFCLLSAVFSRYFLNELIYLFYKKQRPAKLDGTKILISIPKNPSFPSGHASFFFGLSFLLFFYNIELALIFSIGSFFVGLGRVFCGAHWFRDVLGGALAGAFSAILIGFITKL